LFSPINTYNSQLAYLSNVTHASESFDFTIRVLMCVDTFSQKVAFDAFVSRAPVQLVQSYFECRSTLKKAFITGVGNAYSNAALCSNVGIAVLGILIVWYVNRQKSIKRNGQIANKLLTTKMKEYVNEKESEKNLTDLKQSIETMNASMSKVVKDVRVLKKRAVRPHCLRRLWRSQWRKARPPLQHTLRLRRHQPHAPQPQRAPTVL
jgi:hypothetical protein